jgi:putative nucleotidyltransferase with HDIG domain
LGALTTRVSGEDRAIAGQYLTPAQLVLFCAMPINDQRHALDVLHQLLVAGRREPELLQAALLHDVGKSRGRVGLITRVLIVLLRRIDGRLIEWLAAARGAAWRQSLYVHAHHARIGAELAEGVGSSPEVVRLIRQHGDRPGDQLARALYEADERS